jgi:hypothetical protein
VTIGFSRMPLPHGVSYISEIKHNGKPAIIFFFWLTDMTLLTCVRVAQRTRNDT